MIITVSQILIFICIVFFIIFNWIAVYLYQENYNDVKIKISDSKLVWSILIDLENYKKWWPKFYGVDKVIKHVQIIENNNELLLKIAITNLDKNIPKEIWSFIILEGKEHNYLLVKNQFFATSKLTIFFSKYISKPREINAFNKSFCKEYDRNKIKRFS